MRLSYSGKSYEESAGRTGDVSDGHGRLASSSCVMVAGCWAVLAGYLRILDGRLRETATQTRPSGFQIRPLRHQERFNSRHGPYADHQEAHGVLLEIGDLLAEADLRIMRLLSEPVTDHQV